MTWAELLSAWVRAGFAPDDFWKSTPRYIALCLDAALDRADVARQNAWLTAFLVRIAFHQPKDFPAWKKLSARAAPAKPQTPDQMKSLARLFVMAMGGEVRNK